ncbi:MAG: MFS transporter [Bacteroidales bacterium]
MQPLKHHNIPRLYVIKIAKWFMLVMPIIVLFYQDNGLGMQQVFIVQAVYSVSIVILEIPSGYLADVWGRKSTLVTGSVLGLAGYLVYCFSYSFPGFIVAEITLGIGQSLISGADSAILYDSLMEKKRREEYTLYEGRVISLGNFAEAVAGVTGGLLAGVSLRTPFYFQAAVAFMAIPAALTLTEPERHFILVKKGFRHILSIFKNSLWDDHMLRWAILFSAIAGASTLSMAWFVQPFFKAVDIPVPLFGVLWTILNMSVGLAALYSYRVSRFLGASRTLLLFSLGLPLGFILIGLFPVIWALGILLVFYLIRGIATPILKEYINRFTGSDVRATVLSVRNFVIRLLFAVLGPFFGWLTDHLSLQHALVTAGIIFFAGLTLSRIFYLKQLHQQKLQE